ncbi:exosortase-dependent surface protein XDP2 [Trichocoleus sp. DQ-U1]|uniref:exosortase-dependent surface protein XDP2 n=1 Tax=Trichocoleus sp. DQ-U1 TaxID=2933926 RepID=UPI003296EF00
MNFQRTSTFLCLAVGTAFTISSSAQAASFQTNVSQKSNSEADIWLQSITQNKVTIDSFNLVKEAKIISNTAITLTSKKGETANPEAGGYNNNTGAASTDKGDKASKPNGVEVSGIKNPTNTDIATYLGNQNLNNIIDTEDKGSFSINLFFNNLVRADKTGLDNLFFWERGKNSDLGIQAIDKAGNLIGNFLKLKRTDQFAAGYSIDTMEISGSQEVGSWGVSLAQLGITSLAGIRVTADASYNGPDFKVMAREQKVPEPATLAGLGLVAGSLMTIRRHRRRKAS